MPYWRLRQEIRLSGLKRFGLSPDGAFRFRLFGAINPLDKTTPILSCSFLLTSMTRTAYIKKQRKKLRPP